MYEILVHKKKPSNMKFLFLFINEFSCLFLQIDMNGVFLSLS
jgi:hypothetical protein